MSTAAVYGEESAPGKSDGAGRKCSKRVRIWTDARGLSTVEAAVSRERIIRLMQDATGDRGVVIVVGSRKDR